MKQFSENTDDIIKQVKHKYPQLKNISEYKFINDLLCLSCYLDNDSNYFMLYPNGEIKYKTKDNWEYTSNFNKNEYGNGLAFIDLNNIEIIKLYYYKDDLNFDDPIRITFTSSDYIVTEHEERTHIIFLDNFSVSSFGGTEYKIFSPFILFFPYSGYSTYDTFAIIDTVSKRRIELNEKLKEFIDRDEYIKEVGWFFEQSISIDNSGDNLIYHYQHSGEVFKIPIDQVFNKGTQINYIKSFEKPHTRFSNLQQIEGPWSQGISIDIHTLKSHLNDDGSFDTERSYIGELLYRIKYKYDREKISELVEIIYSSINGYFKKQIDIILPVPPSNNNRPFQPLEEIAKELSKKINIPIDLKYITKKSYTPAIKQISNPEDRIKILKGVFNVVDNRYKGKTVLLVDDLYRSGITLKEIANTIKLNGHVDDILALTITKTRTKQ